MKQRGFAQTILLVGVSVISLLVLGYNFGAKPYKVFGTPIQPFTKDEIVLGEKISYLFDKPKVGDRITFKPNSSSGDFIGIISKIENDNNIVRYEVASSTGKNPWKITADQITGKIYYPFIKKEEVKQIISQLPNPTAVQSDTSAAKVPESNPFPRNNPTLTITKNPSATTQPTTKPSPTIPPFKKVTVNGFTYEDRNDDGSFNSDDPKIPYMSFLIYDSYDPNKQISSLFSESDGSFSISLDVRKDLILKPTTYNNFRPRNGQQQFSTAKSGVQFGFRSASAPVVNQSGIVEGDIFQDNNQNGSRDSGEQGIYFYKLYLVDDQGNYYENSTENAQATDAGGHFKYMNLPIGRSFTLRLSNPTGDYTITKLETIISLTNTDPQYTNIQIPVYKR